jgi:hypothetical protein
MKLKTIIFVRPKHEERLIHASRDIALGTKER